MIAQEVEQTNPDLVKTRPVKMHPNDKEKSEIKVVDYSKFTYMLINAVKDLHGEFTGIQDHQSVQDRDLDSLKASLATKDQKIDDLERRNAALKTYLCEKDPAATICK